MSTLRLDPVSLDTKWKHLDGLQLADPEFGTTGNVDLLLGADIFSHVMFQGQRFGPSGSRLHSKCSLVGFWQVLLYLDHHKREFKSG